MKYIFTPINSDDIKKINNNKPLTPRLPYPVKPSKQIKNNIDLDDIPPPPPPYENFGIKYKKFDKSIDTIKLDPIKEGIDSSIINILKLQDNERSLFYYKNNKKYIVLTNKRICKIKNNSIKTEILLNKIQYVNNLKNNIFKSDILEVIDNDFNVIKFSIYNKKVCSNFYKLVKNQL